MLIYLDILKVCWNKTLQIVNFISGSSRAQEDDDDAKMVGPTSSDGCLCDLAPLYVDVFVLQCND